MSEPLRICIVGVGGVGGWLGARLLEAGETSAIQIVFIARGEVGTAIKERGLKLRVKSEKDILETVESAAGAANVYANAAEATASGEALVDYIILATKTWQVRKAAEEAAPLLASGGVVVTTQNGVEAPHEAASAVGPSRVLAGVCKVLAFIAEPGVVEMQAHPSPAVFKFGEAFDAKSCEMVEAVEESPRAARLAAAFETCKGVTSGAEPRIWTTIWEKAVIMCSIGPVGALCRAPIQQLTAIPETKAMLELAMQEIAACGAKAGHLETTEQIVHNTLDNVSKTKPGVTPSTLRDVVMGRPSELYELTGAIRRVGQALGVPTPTHDFIFAALVPQERRARGDELYELLGVAGGVPHVGATG